jgi:hypothetical protein
VISLGCIISGLFEEGDALAWGKSGKQVGDRLFNLLKVLALRFRNNAFSLETPFQPVRIGTVGFQIEQFAPALRIARRIAGSL